MTKYKWLCSAVLMASCFGAHAEDDSSIDRLNSWACGSYLGKVQVSLQMPSELKAVLETDDLILRSVTWEQCEDYLQLFSDPATVEKYVDGTLWTNEEVQERLKIWVDRWESHDPFSAFAVYLKGEQEEFIGHIVLGHGLNEGYAELAFLFKPQFLMQGYGKQAAVAVLYGYVPRLIEEGYYTNIETDFVPSPLSVVHATARLDNPYVVQVLRRIGMQPQGTEVIWGAKRAHYSITAEEILKNKDLREEYAAYEDKDLATE